MRFFLAGIMQGSLSDNRLHGQEYRRHLMELLGRHFPQAELYDPLAAHGDSVEYDEQRGREVFFGHNQMCREVDVLVAFVPEASMGTAIEMWEAYKNGRTVVTISPLQHNWSVKFLSHLRYLDLGQFAAALESGDFAERLAAIMTLEPRA